MGTRTVSDKQDEPDRRASIAGTLRRLYQERNAALRALAPAWPMALVVFVTIVVSTQIEQGKIAVLITTTLERPATATECFRVTVYALTLGFFAFSMTVSSLFAMSMNSDLERARSGRTVTAAGENATPEDPVHQSVSLRTWSAFLLGAATPLAVVWFLMVMQSPLRGWDLWFIPALTAFLAWSGWTVSGPFQSALRSWDRSLQSRYDRVIAQRRMGARADDNWLKWVMAEKGSRLHRTVIVSRLLGIRSVYWGVLWGLKWIATPAPLAVIMVAGGLALYAGLFGTEAWFLKEAIWRICGFSAVWLLFYLSLRDFAMRLVGTSDRKVLVVDRWVRLLHRGLVLAVIASIFVLFWAIHLFYPSAYKALGPASAAMLGLYLTSALLSWFVRTAIVQIDCQSAVRRPLGYSSGLGWSLAVTLPLALLGRVMERLLGLLPAHRLLGLAMALLALDRAILPFLELQRKSLPDGEVWRWVIGIAAIAFAILAGVIASVFSHWAAVRLSRGERAYRRGVNNIWPRPADVPRMNSLLLLLPFLLATLGEDRRPHFYSDDYSPYMGDGGSTDITRKSIDEFARGWLQKAIDRSDARGEDPKKHSIRAIIVLAEGGGIRAAAHIGSLLSSLDDLDAEPTSDTGEDSAKHDDATRHPEIAQDFYVLSGVSGGSLGLAAYLAARAQENRKAEPAANTHGETEDEVQVQNLNDQVNALLNQDMLTPLVVGMFGSDLPGMIIPFNLPSRLQRLLAPSDFATTPTKGRVPNRAEFFETAIARHTETEAGSTVDLIMREPMSKVVESALGSPSGNAQPPIVMFSSFGVENQLRAVASNVRIDNRSDGGDGPVSPGCQNPRPGMVADIQGCLAVQSRDGSASGNTLDSKDIDVPLITAAHLSARFPGSNPPAIFDAYFADPETTTPSEPRFHQLRFVDGGYFDNSGAAASLEAVSALKRAAQDKGVSIQFVVIHAFVRTPIDREARRRRARNLTFDGFMNEVTAPAAAVFEARRSAALFPLETLCREVARDYGDGELTDAHVNDYCANLAKRRAYDEHSPTPSTSTEQSGPPGPTELRAVTCTLNDGSDADGAGVPIWIPAPLDNVTSQTADERLLLGWLLRDQTHDAIREGTGHVATELADYLEHNRSPYICD